MNEILQMCLITIVSSLVTYWLTRRKNKADARGSELDNVEKAVKIWRDLSEGQEKQIKELTDKVQMLEDAWQEKCDSCKYKKHFYKEPKHG